MPDDDFTAANPYDLHTALGSIQGPATTEELLTAAGGADARVVETLRRLPSRTWDSVDAAVAAATMGWTAADQTGGRIIDGGGFQSQADHLG